MATMDQPFPGAVGITDLRVYPWPAVDGVAGGSPHLHLVSSECYVVVGGAGRLETLTLDGLATHDLRPGTVVSFSPGTIHRAVNDGDLRVVVVMANSGLPEAGDAVLTFPPDVVADPAAYAAAVDLRGTGGAPCEERARARRDLAVEGYLRLRAAAAAGDLAPLRELHAAAGRLVADRLPRWRELLAGGPVAAADRSLADVAGLAAGSVAHLADASVRTVDVSGRTEAFGMCGYLRPFVP